MELGPGILNNIFDGIQRPLKQIAVFSGDVFIPRGVAVPALDITKKWEFHPTGFKARPSACRVHSTACPAPCPACLQVNDRITAGDIYGIVPENSLVEHRIMLPPGAKGTISYIAPAGHYTVDEEIIEVDFMGTKKVRGMQGPVKHSACADPCGHARRKQQLISS